MSPVHTFQITSDFGPADLFAALREVCESSAGKACSASFDFDWIKRGVWIEAVGAGNAEELGQILDTLVTKRAGKGTLILGRIDKVDESRERLAIGVLLQSPDVYVEVAVQTLTEFGVTGIRYNLDSAEIHIPVNKANKALDYEQLALRFPLPGYLTMKDIGTE